MISRRVGEVKKHRSVRLLGGCPVKDTDGLVSQLTDDDLGTGPSEIEHKRNQEFIRW